MISGDCLCGRTFVLVLLGSIDSIVTFFVSFSFVFWCCDVLLPPFVEDGWV